MCCSAWCLEWELMEFGVEKRKVILEYWRGAKIGCTFYWEGVGRYISRLLYFMIPLKCVLLSACLCIRFIARDAADEGGWASLRRRRNRNAEGNWDFCRLPRQP